MHKVRTYTKKTKPSKEEAKIARTGWPSKRQKLILQKDLDDEETKSDDLRKYKVVSNKSEVDILCDSIRNDANISGF